MIALGALFLSPTPQTTATGRAFEPAKGCLWREANGRAHRYEIVTYYKDLTWNQADILVSQRTFRGVKGYLATIANGSEDWCERTAILNLSGLRWADATGVWIGANS